MTPRQPPSDEPEIPEPAVHDPAMEIDIGEDLLAAALAAVEKRMEKKTPNPEEMAEIEADIEVDVEGLGETDSVVFGESDLHWEDDVGESDDAPDLAFELEALQEQLAQTRLDARKLKAIGKKELKERRRLTGVVQRLTDQLGRVRTDEENAVEARTSAEAQLDHTRNALQQSRQELTRLRHRQQRDSDEQNAHSAVPVIQEFLPMLDHLELALEHTGASRDTMAEGLRMIAAQFHSALNRLNVITVNPDPGSDFEPRFHEAVEKEESSEYPEGSVLQVQQAGYIRNGRLMRAARVTVSSGPGPEEATAPPSDEE